VPGLHRHRCGPFIDYTELDAASNRGIDEVQTLLEQAVYKPVQGRFKVFMIDEVHMLTGPAFNAMLKTLEEPPEYLKFVLATTDPQKVPVTVLSRCLQFNLRPMAPETVLEHLTHVLQAERGPRRHRRAAPAGACGARLDARRTVADRPGHRLRQRQLVEATVHQMLGSVDRSYVFRLIARWRAATVPPWWKRRRRCACNGLSPASTLEEMGAGAAAHGGAAGRAPAAPTTATTRKPPRSRAWPRPCRPTRPSCCTACACMAAASWAWRRTNTPR
jgi:DNA polymerase-3 subunit gamma/tau